ACAADATRGPATTAAAWRRTAGRRRRRPDRLLAVGRRGIAAAGDLPGALLGARLGRLQLVLVRLLVARVLLVHLLLELVPLVLGLVEASLVLAGAGFVGDGDELL